MFQSCPSLLLTLTILLLPTILPLPLPLLPPLRIPFFPRRDKLPLLDPPLLLSNRSLPLHSLLPPPSPLLLLPQKELSTLDHQIDLTLLSRGRERRVDLLRLIRDPERFPTTIQTPLLEMWQKPIPILIRQLRILGQLALDHQLFDVVYGMDVGHAVLHHPAHLLETFVPTHDADRVPLHEHVRLRQQLQRLQGAPTGAEDALPPLHESLLVAYQRPDLDDVGRDVVLEDPDRLSGGHASRKQLDQVPRVEDRGGIVRLARRLHRHAPFDQVKRACYPVLLECSSDQRPCFT